MCLNPIRMYNPANKISLYGGQRYVIDIPCGECAECREARRTEIYFRSYYEVLQTWTRNGYVYFDTLTYDNAHLPHVSDFLPQIEKGSELDFSCFNREDFRLFMVRLRRQLEYHGFDCKANLKYFVASEYGSDKEYVVNGVVKKATNRPHYHVLFFVTGDIDPLTFSHYVNKCWQKGKTDGIDYQTNKYVLDHVYGPGYNSDEVHMRAVCNYVAKYVLKDSEFEGKLNERILQIFHALGEDEGDNWIYSYAGRQHQRKLKSFMKCYTRWSKEFGVYGLQYNEEDDLYNNKMKIPDEKNIWRFAPLSGYLNKKKYYSYTYNDEGKLYWYLNSDGKERALHLAIQATEQFADRFRDWINNYELLLQKGDLLDEYVDGKLIQRSATSEDILKYQEKLVKDVYYYLNGRSPQEFAFYCMFYRGRVKSWAQLMREIRGEFYVDDFEQFFYRGLMNSEEINAVALRTPSMVRYNYCHSSDYAHFGQRVIGNEVLHYMEDGKKGYHYLGIKFGYDKQSGVYNGEFVKNYNTSCANYFETAEDFARLHVINENSDPRFKDFDKLYNLYSSSLTYYNRRKQQTYDYIEAMKKRMKEIYKKNI